MKQEIVIDIGNNQAKVGIFRNSELLHVMRVSATLKDIPQKWIGMHYNAALVSSTGSESRIPHEKLREISGDMLYFSSDFPFPLNIENSTPKTLGADRKAACAGAASLFPGSPVLVIDAGTAITYDLLSPDRSMKGGNISPGLQMRFDALHNYTGRLPLLHAEKMNETLGKSTAESIQNGVQFGLFSEIEAYIEMLEMQHNNLKIVITGGDAGFLADRLKNSIFVEPNLVLIGLYRILNNYVEKY
ncbi:MAG TPA: type III pantothenate kinase [Bacteroidales bacterium]|nr:type III pantothenate kinase [Bacteroidales bacterium]